MYVDVAMFGEHCRRFLLRHLAQIKHILPEAVHLDWVRSYDADTREKKYEVRISLLPMPAEEVEPNASGSTKKKPRVDTVQRRRAFHSRLVKFASTHPEVSSTIKCHGFQSVVTNCAPKHHSTNFRNDSHHAWSPLIDVNCCHHIGPTSECSSVILRGDSHHPTVPLMRIAYKDVVVH